MNNLFLLIIAMAAYLLPITAAWGELKETPLPLEGYVIEAAGEEIPQNIANLLGVWQVTVTR